ncbi:MAG: immunoglobulin domain-containing protein [Planctomycetes bacterium]|nr:immunoglobulin domain-containing protein [Planctomycetota bacterium]
MRSSIGRIGPSRAIHRLASALIGLLALCGANAAAQPTCAGRWLAPADQQVHRQDNEIFALGLWQPTQTQSPMLIMAGNLRINAAVQAAVGSSYNFSGDSVVGWDGTQFRAFRSLNSTVRAVASFGPDLIVAGDFTASGQTQLQRIARWNGTDWQSLGGGFSAGSIQALTVYNGELIAAGSFSAAGGVFAANIAKWDGAQWTPLGTGIGGQVSALAVYGGELIAAGNFSTAGGTLVRSIARWNGSQWRALTNSSGPSGQILALTVHNNALIAGGNFSTNQSTPPFTSSQRVAAWDGTNWSNLGAGPAENIRCLASFGGALLAGGDSFSSSPSHVFRWNGSDWSPAGGSELAGRVNAMIEHNGVLVAGGFGTNIASAGVPTIHVPVWTGNAWRPLATGLNSPAYAMAAYGGALVAGGEFTSAGGAPAGYFALWTGTAWRYVNNGVNGPIYAMTTFGSDLIVGGSFTSALGVPTTGPVARWRGSSWQTFAAVLNGPVFALTSYNSRVVAAGLFSVSPPTCYNIASSLGGTWQGLGSGMNAPVFALVTLGSDLIAGGSFNIAGGTPANRVARWNGTSWSAMGSGLGGALDSVYALTIFNNEIFAAGSFTSSGSLTLNNIARWNGVSWQPLGAGLNGHVNALTVSNAELIATGSFTTAGGIPARNIARWSGSAWQPLSSGLDAEGTSLAVFGGELIASGELENAGFVASPRFARWTWNGSPRIVRDPTQRTAAAGLPTSFSVAVQGSDNPDSFSWQRNGVPIPLPDARLTVINTATTSTLTINPVQLDDAGTYSCLVTNSCGNVTSAGAILDVCSLPSIHSQPAPASGCPGDTVMFNVGVVADLPTYYWYAITPENGTTYLTDGAVAGLGTVSGSQTATISIADLAPSPLYDRVYCFVSDNCGTSTSDPATLTINQCFACPADFNQDGGVDGGDVTAFFAAWEPGEAAADVNQDGGVDGADISTFFSAWENGGC